MRKYITLGIAAIAVIGGVFVVLQFLKPGAEDTANKFVTAFVQADSVVTYDLLSEQAKKTDTADTWRIKVEKVKGFFSGEPTLKSKSDGKNGLFEYTYEATGKDGTYSFVMVLQKEGGVFKVNSFASRWVKGAS
jgi:hypothetical protein